MSAYDMETDGLKKARVEIIPLIDVIFFLLATFVLFTLSLDRLRVIEARLPKGDPDPHPTSDTLFIQAAADGTYFWKLGTEGVAEPITAPELGPRLAEFRRRTHEPRVVIRSDGKARLGEAG